MDATTITQTGSLLMFKNEVSFQPLLSQIARLHKQARFVSFVYASKSTGSVGRYTFILGSTYRNLCEQNRLELEIALPTLQGVEREACLDMLESLEETLTKAEGVHHSRDTRAGKRFPVLDESGERVANLCAGNDGSLEISGQLHSYVEIKPALVPKSEPKGGIPKAKKELSKRLGLRSWISLAIENIAVARLNGETLELA